MQKEGGKIAKIKRKENKNDSLYELLETSRKTIIKRKKANLCLKVIRKIPFFLQPITSYQIIGDFVINDIIFPEQTTTKSNCLLFNLNSYKKVTHFIYEEEFSFNTIKISPYYNVSSPCVGLLIERLRSLSNYDANAFASALVNISKTFGSFKQVLSLSNFMKSNEEKDKNLLKFETMKNLKEKQFLSSLNHKKPLIIVNTVYNHELNNFEVNEIKINSALLEILGYKPHDFMEQLLNFGIPGLLLFEDYFSGLTYIVQSSLSDKVFALKIKLITCDEDRLYGEAKTYNCKILYENCFWYSFAFEIDIYPWSLQRYKENRMKILKKNDNLNEYNQEILINNNEEIEKFMNKFYPKILKEKFQGKLIFKRAGYEVINDNR